MKRLLSITLLCLLATTALGQVKEVSNLTSAEYHNKYLELTKQGFRPTKIWSKEITGFEGGGGRFGYWARFEKITNGVPWSSGHGLDAAEYQREFDRLVPLGYMPTDINVACVNEVVRYNVIYDKIANPSPWVARHNLNKAEYERAQKDLLAKGYQVKVRSVCSTRAGWVYAVLWQK